MARRTAPAKLDQLPRTPVLPDELIDRFAETMLQTMNKELDDPNDFAAFERGVLAAGNEICRQALKKNSKK